MGGAGSFASPWRNEVDGFHDSGRLIGAMCVRVVMAGLIGLDGLAWISLGLIQRKVAYFALLLQRMLRSCLTATMAHCLRMKA
jgi:hypothetical protein